MAGLALFEDDPSVITVIGYLLEDSPHRVLESAGTLSGAFDVLHRMLSREVSVDLILLDGHLSGISEASEFARPVNNSPDKLVRTGLLRRHVKVVPAEQPSPIKVDESFTGARDAQAIIEVMCAYDVDVPIIGISNDRLSDTLKPDFQDEVDFDLTKTKLADLVTAIDHVMQLQ